MDYTAYVSHIIKYIVRRVLCAVPPRSIQRQGAPLFRTFCNPSGEKYTLATSYMKILDFFSVRQHAITKSKLR